MNPAGTTTGVVVGVAGHVGGDRRGRRGNSGWRRLPKRGSPRTMADTMAINTAAMASVASPRCSHRRDPSTGAGSASTAAGSSSVRGGEGGSFSCLASSGRGASLVDRFSAASWSRNCEAVGRSSGFSAMACSRTSMKPLSTPGMRLIGFFCRLIISGMLGISIVSDQRGA